MKMSRKVATLSVFCTIFTWPQFLWMHPSTLFEWRDNSCISSRVHWLQCLYNPSRYVWIQSMNSLCISLSYEYQCVNPAIFPWLHLFHVLSSVELASATRTYSAQSYTLGDSPLCYVVWSAEMVNRPLAFHSPLHVWRHHIMLCQFSSS